MNEVYERIILALRLMLDTCASNAQKQAFSHYCAEEVQYATSVDEANRMIREKVLSLSNENQMTEARNLLANNGYGSSSRFVKVTVIYEVEKQSGCYYDSDLPYYTGQQAVARSTNGENGYDDGGDNVKVLRATDWRTEEVEASARA